MDSLIKKIKVQCPAKINLTLKITGKRPDGFHNIDSIMQTINLFDYLTISCKPSKNFEIKLDGTSSEIPYDERNLVYKAVKLFFETCSNLPKNTIEIFIEKNIPIAAGLAGGSTDGAGVLFGLNEMFNKPLNENDLHSLCAKLGSDLNFCLIGGRQRTTGRGEILEPLMFEEFSLSLIKPKNLGISAGYAYKKFSEKNSSTQLNRSSFENDLEWGIIDDFEELKYIKRNYPNSMMSGSGSTYFMLNENFQNENGFWIKNNLKSIHYGVRVIDND